MGSEPARVDWTMQGKEESFMIFFSIIIPTCNRNQQLSECLEKLASGQQQFPFDQYEVIVTDDGRDFNAEAFCKTNFPWVKYIQGPQKGPAANRNNGAGFAKAEWLIFLDDDCVPDKDLLKAYDRSITELAPTIKVYEGCIKAIGVKTAFNQEAPVNETGGNLWSCNFCINHHLFEQIHGFEETYPYAAMEDIDLRLKIVQFDNIHFCKGAVVFHPWKLIQNPQEKFKEHLISHKIFFNRWPVKQKEYSVGKLVYRYFYTLLIFIMPKLIPYRARGLNYFFHYSLFTFSLIRFQFRNKFFWQKKSKSSFTNDSK